MSITWNPNEARRCANNEERVLAALREAGPDGLTNVELVKIGGMRAVGGRIDALRAKGYVIPSTRLGNGLWRFVLASEPGGPRPGESGFLASLPVLASIDRAGRVQPTAPPDSGTEATDGRLF